MVAFALLIAGCTSSSSSPAASGTLPVAASSSTPAAAGAAASGPTTIAGYYAQKLQWQPCDHGFQCARLLVPFDYRRPAWRRFSLPVIKLPASDPAHRTGSLVINPGGPGASGITYALAAPKVVSAGLRARFDVVGFDPRGVGSSVPAIQCLTGPQLDKFFATSDDPDTRAELATIVAQS